MPRIKWIDDEDATGELAEIYAECRQTSLQGNVPDILRTMSLRPDLLEQIRQATQTLHFRAGFLTRAQHEMIASTVAALFAGAESPLPALVVTGAKAQRRPPGGRAFPVRLY